MSCCGDLAVWAKAAQAANGWGRIAKVFDVPPKPL